MTQAQKISDTAREMAVTIMKSLVDHNLSYGDALNALMIAFIYSARSAGVDKENLLANISANWDIADEPNTSSTH